MLPDQVRSLRSELGASRSELARFVGVSQITVIRWESEGSSSPRGVPLVLLVAIQRALGHATKQALSHLVRTGPMDHARAIQDLLRLASASRSEDPDGGAKTSRKFVAIDVDAGDGFVVEAKNSASARKKVLKMVPTAERPSLASLIVVAMKKED